MKNVVGIVAVLAIIGGAYWWVSNNQSASDTSQMVDQGASSAAPGTVSDAPMTIEVTYDGSVFTPKDVTIKKGGTVTWKNVSEAKMWVASAQHPSHTVYDGNSRTEHCAADYEGAKPFDQCVGGADYSFTFDKAGKHGYHDHINASAFGSVTVVE